MLTASVFGGKMLHAQENKKPFFTELKVEARADAFYKSDLNKIGAEGKYLNIHWGGNLTEKFSYYFRQRLIAHPGNVKFFDNTDFLYINFQANKNWGIRAGKDALAIGGYEYDARPINVMYTSYYWTQYNCFQLAVTGTYTTNDGNHKFMAQVGKSPFSYTNSPYGEDGLFAYNLMWVGHINHFNSMWSVNLFQRAKKQYMFHWALGNQLVYDKWDIYVDYINRTLGKDDFKNIFADYSLVGRASVKLGKSFNLFIKGGFEQNLSKYEITSSSHENGDLLVDNMALPDTRRYFYGGGLEYRPVSCPAFRIHAYVAEYNQTRVSTGEETSYLNANVGLTWEMDILNEINKQKNKKNRN